MHFSYICLKLTQYQHKTLSTNINFCHTSKTPYYSLPNHGLWDLPPCSLAFPGLLVVEYLDHVFSQSECENTQYRKLAKRISKRSVRQKGCQGWAGMHWWMDMWTQEAVGEDWPHYFEETNYTFLTLLQWRQQLEDESLGIKTMLSWYQWVQNYLLASLNYSFLGGVHCSATFRKPGVSTYIRGQCHVQKCHKTWMYEGFFVAQFSPISFLYRYPSPTPPLYPLPRCHWLNKIIEPSGCDIT